MSDFIVSSNHLIVDDSNRLVIGASPTSASTTSAAVAVGAANAGDVPNSSGAIPSVHLSTAATVVGTFAAILAAFAL